MATPALGAGTLGQTIFWNNVAKSVCVLPATTANTSIPTLITDGIPVYPSAQMGTGGLAFPNTPPRVTSLAVRGTVTVGQVLTGTLTLWGYHPVVGWMEIPVNSGSLITPVALAETQTDIITYTEQYESLGHYVRLAVQLTGIGGTGATFEAWLTTALENS